MAVQAATHGPTHVEVGMSRGMAGMVLFIASEIMLFGGLFAGYFYMRNQADAWPPEGVVGAKAGNHSLFILGIVGAIALGTIFIAGQAYEWFNLMDEGLTAKSGVYGSTFFVMTGFHGAHVIAGLAMLLVVFVRALSRDFTPTRHLFVDASVLYWHFVDVVWVFLYAILYVLV